MMKLKFNDRRKKSIFVYIERCDAHATEEMIREYAKNAICCALVVDYAQGKWFFVSHIVPKP